MYSRRAVIVGSSLAVAGTACCLLSPEVPVARREDRPGDDIYDGPLSLTTPAFYSGDDIPPEHTCEGENVSPRLELTGVPEAASTLAFVVDDPDVSRPEPFVHWLLWNVPASRTTIPPGLPTGERVETLGGATQGTNSAGRTGYLGPCPPPGDGPHTYRFVCHAVEGTLAVLPGSERATLESALAGRTLATATLTGTFGRS